LKHGFTLIELLISVLLVGLLIALTMPMLRGARESSRDLGEIAKIRQHVAVISAYTTDYDGFYPYYVDPEASQHVIRCGEYALITDDYFQSTWYWNLALGDCCYQGACTGPMFYDERDNRWGGPWGSSYHYSSTFLARPEFYTIQVDGRRIRDWVADLANFRPVENVKCENCQEAELIGGGASAGRSVDPSAP